MPRPLVGYEIVHRGFPHACACAALPTTGLKSRTRLPHDEPRKIAPLSDDPAFGGESLIDPTELDDPTKAAPGGTIKRGYHA